MQRYLISDTNTIMSVLIVEDDKKLSDILKIALKNELYSIDTAFDGEEALEKAKKNDYSLILLDIMIPKKDGIMVCQELRACQIHTPIIMLTAKGTPEDRVSGLDIGADDYLVKPFGMLELFARIRAVLRRRKKTNPNISKIDNLIIDRNKHEVTRGNKVILLTPKEYKLLDFLIIHYGEAMKRQALIDYAWGPGFVEKNNELNVHIKYLRNKIDTNNNKPLINTVRGVGFVIKD